MKKFDFIKNRKIYFAISGCIILIGILASFVLGVELDIQFKGGSIVTYSYVGDVDLEKVESVVEDAIGATVTVNNSEDLSSDAKYLMVTLASDTGLSADQQEAMTNAVTEAFPDNAIDVYSSQSVNPTMGSEFFVKSIIAVALAAVLIIIYVALRFKRIGGWSAGVMGIVALFHDVFVVYTVFVLFRMPLDANFIAVVLTILGFSINDTIVIYDRIRENKKLFGNKMDVAQLTNLSINQSMTRSVNTSLNTLFTMIIVCIIALIGNLDSIMSFSLPMVFGLISGVYSTICIAGPLWVTWQEHKLKKKAA